MRDHPVIEQVEGTGYPNLADQPAHSGTDYFGDEILEGDEIVIDGEEMILKNNLEDYLSDVYGLEFTTAK
ncbi:hypothetical protein J7E38_13500 [Bacillus sp. ISL-35]|uniref:YqaI family protein n=1 Tax=Bacillus sp. ISL-35 TaxID=2819122 RepID=UPI001BEC21FB|nr:hypothetical protein [Bacillus sp. ISL-35]MBT2680024.1 hypothetical protein [Bacillus sp. ISL-35]MBT2703000.1 hypothetical protein [Chryseobacterium sp. ISL-80]